MLAPALSTVVQPFLGWPVLAIAPCRDFQLLIGVRDTDQISRLAQTVTREYLGSPYPLSTDVFRIDDQINAIGTFAV